MQSSHTVRASFTNGQDAFTFTTTSSSSPQGNAGHVQLGATFAFERNLLNLLHFNWMWWVEQNNKKTIIARWLQQLVPFVAADASVSLYDEARLAADHCFVALFYAPMLTEQSLTCALTSPALRKLVIQYLSACARASRCVGSTSPDASKSGRGSPFGTDGARCGLASRCSRFYAPSRRPHSIAIASARDRICSFEWRASRAHNAQPRLSCKKTAPVIVARHHFRPRRKCLLSFFFFAKMNRMYAVLSTSFPKMRAIDSNGDQQ